jgi:hypothetical protein
MNIFLSKKTLFFLFFLAILPILAEIIEIKHFHEILDYVTPGCIVLVDMDNTLIEPHPQHNHVGSDQWFTRLLQTHKNFELAVNLYCSTVLNVHMLPVEPTIPEILNSIQQQATLLGFTMRSIVLAPCTVERLAHNHIIFPCQLPDKGFMINDNPVLVYHDIIFCQGKKNGITLFTVLEAYAIKPSVIVMIDDKKSYLESVECECKKIGVEFIGLRYGYLDEKVAQFLQAHAL